MKLASPVLFIRGFFPCMPDLSKAVVVFHFCPLVSKRCFSAIPFPMGCVWPLKHLVFRCPRRYNFFFFFLSRSFALSGLHHHGNPKRTSPDIHLRITFLPSNEVPRPMPTKTFFRRCLARAIFPPHPIKRLFNFPARTPPSSAKHQG